MSSELQIIANRKNGKLGGVKTEAGKKVVRFNAVTHGLLSKQVLLPGENARLLRQLSDDMMSQYQPEGEVETLLVDTIVSCIWRSRRFLMLEKWYLTGKEGTISSRLSNIIYCRGLILTRYENHIDRKQYQAMHELERIQAIRRGKNVPVPVTIDLNTVSPN